MRRPKKRSEQFPNKRKIRAKHVPQEELEAAAVGATYVPSPYHCKENGRLRRRIKPATPCPRNFTLQEGDYPGLDWYRIICHIGLHRQGTTNGTPT
jgi:hypothetical protein